MLKVFGYRVHNVAVILTVNSDGFTQLYAGAVRPNSMEPSLAIIKPNEILVVGGEISKTPIGLSEDFKVAVERCIEQLVLDTSAPSKKKRGVRK